MIIGLLEIACIETQNLIPTKRIFYKLINPERDVSADASKNSWLFNYEVLKNKEKFADIAKEFKNFISEKNSLFIMHLLIFHLLIMN